MHSPACLPCAQVARAGLYDVATPLAPLPKANMLAARTLPSVHFSAPSRRATRNQRAAVTVAAAAPVTVTTLPDGRKIEVYPTTADAASAVAASFVSAYKQARLGVC